MVAHKIDVGDASNIEDAPGGATNAIPEVRKTYVVVAETGLFKNGQTYKKGDKVELTEETAKSALAAGDVKEK